MQLGRNESERNKISSDLKLMSGSRFQPPEISMPSSTTISFKFPSQPEILVGYERWGEKALTLGSHLIKLDQNKTLINYKSEIELALRTRKTAKLSAFLIPEAYAASEVARAPEWATYFIAHSFYVASYYGEGALRSEPRPNDLEGLLTQFYAVQTAEFESAIRRRGSGHGSVFEAFMPVFKCDGPKLMTLDQIHVRTQGDRVIQSRPGNVFHLERTSDGYAGKMGAQLVRTDFDFQVPAALRGTSLGRPLLEEPSALSLSLDSRTLLCAERLF